MSNFHLSNEEEHKEDPLRPKYHFLPPSNWMNDPNGPIFYKEEYHLFYQYNPTGNQWGNIHWGHAKSKDLVYWEYLPIALSPSKEKGETHCFSGCCVLDNGRPIIIYTSVGPNKSPSTGAEQWLAFSNVEMITWKKYEKNPIMTNSLHEKLEIHDWRDPFVWKEEDIWYLILGGHIKEPVQPIVLLYKSYNLYDWKYVGPLLIEDKSKGKNWECPNFFKLDENYILIVSPHNRVIYSIGSYDNYQFKPNKWNILDYGKLFYATNVMKDKNNRIILWAWIKAKGSKNWNGCLTLPRIISLSHNNNKLTFKFPSELQKLRKSKYCIENIKLDNQIIYNPFDTKDFCFEIQAELQLINLEIFYIKLTKNKSLRKEESIGFDLKTNNFWVGKDKVHYIISSDDKLLKLHIYIDVSIIEVIINDHACITTQIIPKDNFANNLEIGTVNGSIMIRKLLIWNLKSIW